MEKNEYEVFVQTYEKVEAICTEIMNKLACEEGGIVNDHIVNSECPEYESLVVNNDGSIEFAWIEEEYGREIERGTVIVPKEVFIKENIDEWCESVILERKKQLEDIERETEADERALYERLKKKYEK